MVFSAAYMANRIACCGAGSPDPGVEAATPTGLQDTVTGQPVYATYDDAGAVLELFYFDPVTGAKIVTTTGFSPTTTTDSEIDTAYDTLASGVVERLRSVINIVDGVPQAPIYTLFSTGAAYVPAGTIAPKPQRVQMGQEDLTVTGAGVALAAIPGVSNSEGQKFPAHAVIHVQVDSASGAAGVAFTTNGVNPTEAHEFERSQGQPIVLDSYEEIDAFRVAPINGAGDLAPALSIQLTIEYNNIADDKDDV